MSLQYVGNKELMSVVTGALYTAGSGTLTLQAGQGALLPASGVFWIRQATVLASTAINILKVTAVTGDVLTVVGGEDGTTDQNIAGGTVMCWVLGASALTMLKSDTVVNASLVDSYYQPTQRVAGVASTDLVASALGGLYQVMAYVQTSSTNATPLFLDVTISWTFNGVVKTANIVNGLNLGVADSAASGVETIRVDNGTAISFTITVGAGAFGYLPTVSLSKIGPV